MSKFLLDGIILMEQFNNNNNVEINNGRLFQVGVYGSLIKSVFKGEFTFADLAQHGDFGLGTFDGINGEMLAFDGVFYKIQEDGKVCMAQPDDVTPFANVTFFKPSLQFQTTDIDSYSTLTKELENNITNKNIPYALRFDTLCDCVCFSVVRGQTKPFPPIEQIKKTRIETTIKNISGTILGFWIPPYWSPVAKIGLHLRFISEDRTTGGQLHDVILKQATLKLQPLHRFEVYLPYLKDFSSVVI